MTDYDKFVDSTWFGKGNESLRDLFIMTTGLGGEAGEVQEKLKKYVRDDTLDPEQLKLELGDVLYYLTKIAHRFGYTLDDVMAANITKLEGRIKRNTMRGSGDNR